MKKLIGLLAAAVVVLAAAYHALMYYDNNFRYGRMRETPAVKPHEEPLKLMEAGVVPANGGEALYRLNPAAAAGTRPGSSDPEAIARGRAVYFTYCAQCHGPEHNGQGTVGQSFHPLPTDLRTAPVQTKPEPDLFTSVSYGIPGGRQPALHTTITAEDRWKVVAYIKSLGLKAP
jgi:mono/diheme cytochrome c family protein